jgi:hypothetical protein
MAIKHHPVLDHFGYETNQIRLCRNAKVPHHVVATIIFVLEEVQSRTGAVIHFPLNSCNVELLTSLDDMWSNYVIVSYSTLHVNLK